MAKNNKIQDQPIDDQQNIPANKPTQDIPYDVNSGLNNFPLDDSTNAPIMVTNTTDPYDDPTVADPDEKYDVNVDPDDDDSAVPIDTAEKYAQDRQRSFETSGQVLHTAYDNDLAIENLKETLDDDEPDIV